MKPCLLIPIYDQPERIETVIEGLAPLGLPALVVDDGSGAETRDVLERCRRRFEWLDLERHDRNLGRGAALWTGYAGARKRGFSHALQLDADGQHDPRDAPALLAAAQREPRALVLGAPRFDASAPASRRYGRWICRAWVWLETRSLAVEDPLCGMRCTPLAPALALFERGEIGSGMECDVELLVRLVWEGLPVANVPVRVRYFENGVSHYHVGRDNWRLSRAHARLCWTWLGCALRGAVPRAAREMS